MIVTLNMCMPAGDAMRQRFGELLEVQKIDNRDVIAAMLAADFDVPDTMSDLGLHYVPEQHRKDAHGQPIMAIYGMRDMLDRGTFSCGDAAAYEAAVMEEKYGIRTLCLAVPQGDDDLHAVYVTPTAVVDPTMNWLQGRRPQVRRAQNPIQGQVCWIEDGRVVCNEGDRCCVDERGVWNCPKVPGLTGKRERIGPVQRSPKGRMWARTPDGAVVPVCPAGKRGRR